MLEKVADPAKALELSCLGTDGIAALCAVHPARFSGFIATMPMNNPTGWTPRRGGRFCRLPYRNGVGVRDLVDLPVALRDIGGNGVDGVFGAV